MRAVVRDRYGPPEVLRVVEVPDPEPGPDEVVVRVDASSVNTADADLLLGRPRAARLGTGWPRPRSDRMGLDLAGTVVSVGTDVTSSQPGDLVWADLFAHGCGAFAERVRVPASALALRPAGVTAQVAAAVPHSGVLALQALRAHGPVRTGDRVLVNGAGGCVGPFAVQLAVAAGAEVTGVDRGDRLELVRHAGAHHVVDHLEHDITRGTRRFDVVVDVVGNRSPLRWRRVLLPGGRYALVAGSVAGFVRAASFGALPSPRRGTRVGAFTWRPNLRQHLDELARLLESGAVAPVLGHEVPLEGVADALRQREAGRTTGKVVVVPAAQGAGGR